MANGKEKVLEELTLVKFIGPSMAERLYTELEIRSLEDLIQAGRAGKLTSLSGIGERTQKTIISSAERQVAAKNAALKGVEKPAATPKVVKKAVEKPVPPVKKVVKKAAGKAESKIVEKVEKPAAAGPKAVEKAEPKTVEKVEKPAAAGPKAVEKAEPKIVEKPVPVVKKAEPKIVEKSGPVVKKAVEKAEPKIVERVEKPAAKKIEVGTKKSQAVEAPGVARADEKSLQDRFLDTLRCPACGHDAFESGEETITCQACQRQFSAQHGIVDLAPPHVPERTLTQRIMELRFYAQFYEDFMRPKLTGVVSDRTMREEFRLAADFLELDENTRLLDVAAGTTNFTRYFAERLGLGVNNGPSRNRLPLVVAMDLSWPMLETARGYLRRESLDERVFLLRGDATRIPIKRGTYNRLHCSAGLHLMNDIDEALRNFARVLEPGGICVVGTFILGEGLLRRFIKRAAEIPTKFHWFSREELHRRMERAGFEILDESVSGDAITIKARRI